MRFSLSLIPAFAGVAFGQGAAVTAAAETTAAVGAPVACGGCFIVANVAAILFANYTITNTATVLASQGVNRNGTITSQTMYELPLPAFSFNPTGVIAGATVTGNYIPITGSVLTISGSAYTSPTAYNVFQGYTEYTIEPAGATCKTGEVFASTFPKASSVLIEGGYAASALAAQDAAFASAIGLRCPLSQVIISSTIGVQTSATTVTSSTTGRFQPTLAAATTTGTAAAGTSSDSGVSVSGSASSSPSSPAISMGAAPAFRAQSTFTSSAAAGVLAVMFALPAFGAWVL